MRRIEQYDAWIVQKGRLFLQGRRFRSGQFIWTLSRYDAWRARKKEDARRVARATGGTLVRFNPISGESRMDDGAAEKEDAHDP